MGKGMKLVAENRKAYHEYELVEKEEAGIVLKGTEVKSIRQGAVNLKESFIRIKNGEMILYGMHISPYEQGNRFNVDPLRERVLLFHKRESLRWYGKVKQEGYTIVPTKLYFRNGYIKLEVALAKGKKLYDKRESLAKREVQREMEKNLRARNR